MEETEKSDCVPLYEWDSDLAATAQAWADQCALVEYDGEGVEMDHGDVTRRLHHDSPERRAALVQRNYKVRQKEMQDAIYLA